MTVFSSPSHVQTASTIVLGLTLLLSSCVKKSEYEQLMKEKDEVEAQLNQANQQFQQSQATLQLQQARLFQLINIQSSLQKREKELQDAQDELKALRAEFDKFRAQRRSAMIGKKHPILHLDSGQVLTNAEVTGLDAAQITFRHDGGSVKVALAKSTEDLRWEACYIPAEAQQRERERMISDARKIGTGGMADTYEPAAPKTTAGQSEATAELKTLIAAQRAQLNQEYAALKTQNPSALKNIPWNAVRPETSQLLNDLGSRPAVLGLSRLDALRDTINNSLATLQSLGAKAP